MERNKGIYGSLTQCREGGFYAAETCMTLKDNISRCTQEMSFKSLGDLKHDVVEQRSTAKWVDYGALRYNSYYYIQQSPDKFLYFI